MNCSTGENVLDLYVLYNREWFKKFHSNKKESFSSSFSFLRFVFWNVVWNPFDLHENFASWQFDDPILICTILRKFTSFYKDGVFFLHSVTMDFQIHKSWSLWWIKPRQSHQKSVCFSKSSACDSKGIPDCRVESCLGIPDFNPSCGMVVNKSIRLDSDFLAQLVNQL